MSTQSYPWLKMPHRQYLVSITYAALKPVERLAFLELAMYAHTQADNQLPDNDSALAGWADMSVKQWLKVKANVFSEWLLKDGFWLLPSWFVVESAPVVKRESEQDDEPKKAMTNAERQAAYKARQAELALLAEQSNVTGNGEVTEGNGASNEKVTTGNGASNEKVTTGNGASNEKVTTGNAQVTDVSLLLGGKGGDLDLDLKQDLELNQEVNTTTNVVSAPHTSERVKNKKSQSNFSANEMILSCETLSAEVANDFINYRKAKKAPLTSSAWKTMVSEIQHSGMTPDNALSETMSAGWVGVKAEWLINRNAKQSPNVIPMSSRPKLPSQMTEDERQELRRKNAAEAKKILFGDDDFIDGVASHV